MPKDQFFSHIMARTSDDVMMTSALHKTKTVSWILIALDMPLHSDTFFQFQSLLLLLSVVYLVEKQQI
jgi:hypothetical protein